MEPQIGILDMGGQYARLIAKELRKLHVRSEMVLPDKSDTYIRSHKPKGMIISGGWSSVYDIDAPKIPETILNSGIPLLGICFGMQWLAHKLDGRVESVAENREFGPGRQFTRANRMGSCDRLFGGLPHQMSVLTSHGDSVTKLPIGAFLTGSTPDCPISAFSLPGRNIYAVQFHPECQETQQGSRIFANFLEICGAEKDWNPGSVVAEVQANVLQELKGAKLVHLFSGGVDSTVLAAILEPVLKDRLICAIINTGGLREGEIIEIRRNAVAAKCSLHQYEAKQEFMAALVGLIGGEEKRLAFQKVYAGKLDFLKAEFKTPYATQGTLATDLIRSGKMGGAALIHTHHNASVESINPFRDLFKDEVREIARFLGLPDFVSERMPFPGPGLYIRVVNIPISEEMIAMARWADAQATKIMYAGGIAEDISQIIVGIGLPRVGIKGDGRVNGYCVLVRAMQSVDFMTGKGYEIPSLIRRSLIHALTQHPYVTDVLFSETNSPCATFEFE